MLMNIQPLDPVAFSLGPLDIHWYGILIAGGMFLAYLLANYEANRKGLPEGTFVDLMFYIIIASLIGARLYYVLFNFEYYVSNPMNIIRVDQGGMAIHGGLIGGFLAGLIYSRVKGYSFMQIADIAAPSILLGQIIGRIGNFINQEAHGGEVTREFLESLFLPEFIINQMYIDGAYYHPTFLYESVWNIVGLIIILLVRPHLKIGQSILLYLIYYSIGRYFIEGMRTDSLMVTEGLRAAQMISILIIVGAIAVWIYRNWKYELPKYKDVNGVFNHQVKNQATAQNGKVKGKK
ncbi:MAG TPA: prolipoprotein diacylglyceryl transferase [Aliicoccus persicus]|uniref:Phosphatidylglycerol--prolipoprotein diacylglyceryl transferase n=1 Tax=Aliicoccus persicus TaxID=930138 RepID=A0A921JCF0_9STAP|nr:prolipoprotein diacylglyceryl transferase [Aliicoccus persicus]